MRCSVEVYAQKPLFLKDNAYISLSLMAGGEIVESTKGRDIYVRGTAMLSEKRLAGIGRCHTYDINSRPLGLGSLEARPGTYVDLSEDQRDDVVLKIDTNTILDPGLLRDQWGIRFVNQIGKSYDVPLARPDIQIHWDGRGSYTIPISEFVTNKLMFPVAAS